MLFRSLLYSAYRVDALCERQGLQQQTTAIQEQGGALQHARDSPICDGIAGMHRNCFFHGLFVHGVDIGRQILQPVESTLHVGAHHAEGIE